ncbi:MAG: HPr kinase/phosphorylase, partial [Bryobacteraceae bacterium]
DSPCAFLWRRALELGLSGEAERVHATAIAVAGRGALIRGPSGSGKSDLALRCLGLGRSALLCDSVNLVADDQVMLWRDARHKPPRLLASAPATLRGKLEVRGVGILEVAVVDNAEIVLVAELGSEGPIERFPEPWPKTRILGFDLPLMRLQPFESSAPHKLVAALAMAALPRAEHKA